VGCADRRPPLRCGFSAVRVRAILRFPAQRIAPEPSGAVGLIQGATPLSSVALMIVLAGAFLSKVDAFVVNVALPDIGSRLRASDATLELVVAGYGLSYAALLVLGGRIGDAIGRRRVFVFGIGAFTVSSLLCGLAPLAGVLVAGRVLQGAAAAVMFPQVLGIIQSGTSGATRVRALAWYASIAGGSLLLGQLAGGLIVAANVAGTGWRLIFLINVPLGLVALLLAPRLVPESRAKHPLPADVAGTVCLGLCLLVLLAPLAEGPSLHWPLWCVLLLGTFPLAVAILILVERAVGREGGVPVVPPRVLRMPSMRRALALAIPYYGAWGGFLFVYSLFSQQALHWSALEAGLGLAALGVGFLVASFVTTALVEHLGGKTIALGLFIQALGYLSLTITVAFLGKEHLNPAVLAPASAVTGFGQGLAMSRLVGLSISDLPHDLAGLGSAVFGTTQQACLAIGVAVLGALYFGVSAASGRPFAAFLTVLAVETLIAAVGTLYSRTFAR
jgi:MFS family permease